MGRRRILAAQYEGLYAQRSPDKTGMLSKRDVFPM